MKFRATAVVGAWIIEPERHEDERGYFARTWCQKEFVAQGLSVELAQCSVSFNRRAGTLRGMHYQVAPGAETKLVRCTRGAIYDVALDLRPASPTFKRWAAAELTADNGRVLYIPAGCAHGFLTLADDTEVFYQISAFHDPALARGVRWDDPAFGIQWPRPVTVISERDRSYADFATNSCESPKLTPTRHS